MKRFKTIGTHSRRGAADTANWPLVLAGALIAIGLLVLVVVWQTRLAGRVTATAPAGAAPSTEQDEGQLPPPRANATAR